MKGVKITTRDPIGMAVDRILFEMEWVECRKCSGMGMVLHRLDPKKRFIGISVCSVCGGRGLTPEKKKE